MKIKVEVDESAVDIPTMKEMSIGEYEKYIKDELLFVDHHDVLRSAVGQYPLATNREQMSTLIKYLQKIESTVGNA